MENNVKIFLIKETKDESLMKHLKTLDDEELKRYFKMSKTYVEAANDQKTFDDAYKLYSSAWDELTRRGLIRCIL